MSFGGDEKEDPTVARREQQLEAEKTARNRRLMLQRIAAMRRMRSGGATKPTGDQQTLG